MVYISSSNDEVVVKLVVSAGSASQSIPEFGIMDIYVAICEIDISILGLLL